MSAGFALPLDTAPMEAKSAPDLPEQNGPWQYEPKWDGFRCLAFKSGDAIELRAKSGKPLGRYFPDVVAMLAEIDVPRIVIDGELVIEVEDHLDFEALQMRLHPAESRIKKLAAATPARFVAFDLLAGPDGSLLLDQPLEERRRRLEAVMRRHAVPKRFVLSPMTRKRTTALTWLSSAGQGATDGVVAKRLDEPYRSGERAMIKTKRLRTADCVVGGFRYESRGRAVGSLLLGLYDPEGKLDHVGFTSTIVESERMALTKRLEALRRAPGFTGKAPGGLSRWSTERSEAWEPLAPELVVEVRFDHVTAGRFRHGTKLMRWRPDKPPQQCTFEQIASAVD